MPTHQRDRQVSFDVRDNHLIRTVVFPATGKSYTHRCTRAIYEAVAHAIEEHAASGGGSEGVALDSLVQALDAPFTQVNVALEFMKERTCVVTRGRRSYPASKALFEDAMTEFCFLADLPY
ncbi:MAG: hypothetical protein ACYC26_15955 [Phycisphaerales bacterium]